MRLMMVAALAAVSLATLAAAVPASAQSPRAARNDTETITVIDQNGHRTTRITVRPRSFLDPGTETKPLAEHDMDYAVQPGTYPGEYLYDRNDWKSSWSRMPFPSCADLPGVGYCNR
jgi:hypothetical protein